MVTRKGASTRVRTRHGSTHQNTPGGGEPKQPTPTVGSVAWLTAAVLREATLPGGRGTTPLQQLFLRTVSLWRAFPNLPQRWGQGLRVMNRFSDTGSKGAALSDAGRFGRTSPRVPFSRCHDLAQTWGGSGKHRLQALI